MNKSLQKIVVLPCKVCRGSGTLLVNDRQPETGDELPTLISIGGTCAACAGTGLRFPTLSQMCSHCKGDGKARGVEVLDFDICQECFGTKRVLANVHLEDLLDAMLQGGFPYEIEADESGVIIRFHNRDSSKTLVDDFVPKLTLGIVAEAVVKALDGSSIGFDVKEISHLPEVRLSAQKGFQQLARGLGKPWDEVKEKA